MSSPALGSKLTWPKYRYILVTTVVSLLAFARNLLFMKTLDLASLGQIALMQTLVMLVGFVQIGLINGAFIQYAARDPAVNRRIVDLMATGLLLLLLVAAVAVAAARLAGINTNVLWPQTLTIGVAAGIASLASTWLNNALIADGQLGRSNLINLFAVVLSLAVALLSRSNGLTFALLAMLIQPLTVALAAMAFDRTLRPRTIRFDGEMVHLLLRLGFTPFISGVFVLAMHQIERWSIAAVLGSNALGQFYIVLMYATFFALIPAALMNVFLPQARRAFAAKESKLLTELVRLHLRDLIVYFALALLITLLIMPPALKQFLPEFSKHRSLVYYALPGLVLFTLRDTGSLVLFSTGRMQPLLVAGLAMLMTFGVSLLVIWLAGRFSLVSVLVARAGASLLGTALLLAAQQQQIKQIRHS